MQSNRRITKDTECKAVLSRNINDGRIQQDWHGGYGKAEREREREREEREGSMEEKRARARACACACE